MSWERYYYWSPELETSLPLGEVSPEALLDRTEMAEFSREQVQEAFSPPKDNKDNKAAKKRRSGQISTSQQSFPDVTVIGEVHQDNSFSFRAVQQAVQRIRQATPNAMVLVALEGNFDGIFAENEGNYEQVRQSESENLRRSRRRTQSTVSPQETISQGVTTDEEAQPITNLLNSLRGTRVLIAGVDKRVDDLGEQDPKRDLAMVQAIQRIASEHQVTHVVILVGSAHIADSENNNDKQNVRRLGNLLMKLTNGRAGFVNPYPPAHPYHNMVASDIERLHIMMVKAMKKEQQAVGASSARGSSSTSKTTK